MSSQRLRRAALRATVAVTAFGSAFGLLGTARAYADTHHCEHAAVIGVCINTVNVLDFHEAWVVVSAPAPLDGDTQAGLVCSDFQTPGQTEVFLVVNGIHAVVPLGALPEACPDFP